MSRTPTPLWQTCPLLAAVLVVAPLVGTARADPSATVDLLFAARVLDGAAIAPNGIQVAWTEAVQDAKRTESADAQMFVLDGSGAAPRRVLPEGGPPHTDSSPAWSPDGTQLAFLSDAGSRKQAELLIEPASGGPARTLTRLVGILQRPKWSPDGRMIALLFTEGAKGRAGATQAAEADDGEVQEHPREQRIALVDASSGDMRVLTPNDTYIYEYDWSPDSRKIAFTSAKGSGDNNWWIARLSTIGVEGGAVTEIYRPTTQIAVPRWSPDGRRIAFIQGLMSDAGSTGGDLWWVGADGMGPRNLTPGRGASPAWIHWIAGTNQILFTERVHGGAAAGLLDPESGAVRTLWRADETLYANEDDLSLSVTPDGSASAVFRSAWNRPPELWTGPVGAWEQRTRANAALKPQWGASESVEWKSDGRSVQGWLLYPKNYDPAAGPRRYPMIVSIHGGPSSQKTPLWPRVWFDLSVMAGEGYFVFFPNPRGSYGMGEAFTAGNVRDFGAGDLRDILTGVDEVVQRFPVDPSRLGVGGWSYGGFMTMWTVTQSGRFRAAVAGAGIANWQSYYGQNLIDQWMIPFFGASVYDDPEIYAARSPILRIKDVRTPTLVVAGGNDKECPAAQSYEFWHGLRAIGVPTKLVVYQGEGHHFNNPAHIVDLYDRTIRWYDDHLR